MHILLFKVWKIWSATHQWCTDFIKWWSDIGHHLCLHIFFGVCFFLNCYYVGSWYYLSSRPVVFFLFSSDVSTRFWVMAFTYGCHNHTHWTHTHTCTHACTHGRIPLDKWSARHRDLYMTTHNTHRDIHPCPWWYLSPQSQQTRGHRPTLWTVQPQLLPQFTYLEKYCYLNVLSKWITSFSWEVIKKTEIWTQRKRCLVKLK